MLKGTKHSQKTLLKMNKPQVEKTCQFCTEIYFVKKSRENKSKFCSQICRSRGRRGFVPRSAFKKGFTPWNKGLGEVKKSCLQCGVSFLMIAARKETAKFCGRVCADKYYRGKEFRVVMRDIAKENPSSYKAGENTGEEHHNWKGGITLLNHAIRSLLEMKLWREHVFQQHDYTCQGEECGKRGGRLNADHIIPFAVILQVYNIKTVEDARACDFLWDIRNGRVLCEDCHRKTDSYGYGARKQLERLSPHLSNTH